MTNGLALTDPQSKLASRLGAISLLAGVVLAAAQGLILPVIDAVGSHRAEMDLLHERLDAIDAEAARIPALRQTLEELGHESGVSQGLWTGATDNAISVAIQSRLRQMFQSSGVNLSRLDASVIQDASGYKRHMLRVGFTGGDRELTDVLVALARQRPYLKFEVLTVRGREVKRPSEPGDETFAVVLTAELELAGLGLADDAKGAPP